MKDKFKLYRKKTTYWEIRPYVKGESMKNILTSSSDTINDSLEGGMVVRSPLEPEVQWYLAKEFFDGMYEQVTQDEYISKMPQPWRYAQNTT